MASYLGCASQEQPSIHAKTNLSSYIGQCQQHQPWLVWRKLPPANNNESTSNPNPLDNNLSSHSMEVPTGTKPFSNTGLSMITNKRQIEETATSVTSMKLDRSLRAGCLGDLSAHSQEDVLTSWTELQRIVWTGEDAVPAFIPDTAATLNAVSLARIEFPNVYFADELIVARLNYFKYLRSDFEVMVKVNATPFQQGSLWIYFDPLNDGNNKLVYQLPNDYHEFNGCGLAQLSSFPGVLLNLEDTNSVVLRFPLTYPEEHIDLSEPYTLGSLRFITLSPLRDATASPSVTLTVMARCVDPVLSLPTNKPCAYGETYDAQVGEEGAEKGIVTKIAETVETVSDVLSNVPVIAPIAKTVSWIARMTGKVASAFGFSVPDTRSETLPIVDLPGYGAQLVEGIVPGQNMGAIQDNSVALLEQHDEMSIAHLCSVRTLIDAVPLTTISGRSAGDILWSQKVHVYPESICSDIEDGGTLVCGGPLQVVASNFDHWRGSITYTFTLVKTKFVSGRLKVQYFPDRSETADTNINRVYTQIWDVEVDSTFTFTVPFSSARAFNACTTSGDYAPEQGLGTVAVSVFNPFVHPDTVSAYMDLLVWQHSDDIMFANPSMTGRLATAADYPAPPTGSAIVAEVQSGYEGEFENSNCEVAKYATGEYISSLRQLAKKKRFIKTAEACEKVYACELYPFLSLYTMWRGSARFLIHGDAVKAFPAMTGGTARHTPFSKQYPWFLSPSGLSQLTVPYYSIVVASSTGMYLPGISLDAEADIYMSGGDDFSAWNRRGPLGIVVPTT